MRNRERERPSHPIQSLVGIKFWPRMETPYKKSFESEDKKKFRSVLIVYLALVLDNVLLTVVGKFSMQTHVVIM